MKTSVIIPTYNRADVVSRSVTLSLTNCGLSREQIELIWIDDCSPSDDVHKVMHNLKPDISIFKNKNEGTIKTKNQGMILATGERICVMDSDFQMSDNWLKIANDIMDKIPKIKVIAMSDLNRDRWQAEAFEMEGYHFNHMLVNLVTGVFLIDREVLDTVGYLDEDFIFYGGNDGEWTMRIRKAGFLIVYSSLIHGHHLGYPGEPGDNREKKQANLDINRKLSNTKGNSPTVYHNPFILKDHSNLIDQKIRGINES